MSQTNAEISHQFLPNFYNFGGYYRYTHPAHYRSWPNLSINSSPTVCLRAKFHLDQFILSPSSSEFFFVFGPSFVLSPLGDVCKKLNANAQLQTWPYPTISKSFLYSSVIKAKSCTQTLLFKSVNKKRFRSPICVGLWSPSLTKLGMMIQDLEHFHAPPERFGGMT